MPKDIKEFKDLRVKIDDVIYMPNLEAPLDRPHPFVYFISICNESPLCVKIRGRKWVVVEENGETTVVEGDGVIGQQPIIPAGEYFCYNSYHVIDRAAQVSGSFFGETESGDWFFTRIPEFRLELPKWI